MGVSTKDIQIKVTDQIIEGLKGGKIAWEREWATTGTQALQNLSTNKPYSGINVFLLGMFGYEVPLFGTFPQIENAGGMVRKGEKAQMIVYTNWMYFDKDGKLIKKPTPEQIKTAAKKLPFLKYHNVFNVSQCTGLDKIIDEWHEENAKTPKKHDDIETAEAIVAQTGANIIHTNGDRAYYQPSLDKVTMPLKEFFKTIQGYYSTLFHEIGHWTGHGSRLKREGIVGFDGFGSHKYSFEELVAEMTAAIVLNYLGIANDATNRNTLAYIQSWIQKLGENPDWIMKAATAAQKAADLIIHNKITKYEN